MCICACLQDKADSDTGRQFVAKVNKAALSTTAGHMCCVCPEATAQIKLHIRIQTALHVYYELLNIPHCSKRVTICDSC